VVSRDEALLGYGAVATSSAVGANRMADTANRRKRLRDGVRVREAEQRLAGARSAPRTPPPPGGWRANGEGLQRGAARRKARAGQAQRVKQAAGQVSDLRAELKRPAMGRKAVGRVTAGGLSTGLPALWLGARERVKKATTAEVDRYAAGGLVGGGAYQAGVYGSKRIDRKINAKVAASTKLRDRYAAHKQTHGNPTQAGDPRWKGMFRSYPRDLPGWQFKRAMGYAGAGKTGVAMTGGAALAGGTVANNKLKRKARPVKKAESMQRVGKRGDWKTIEDFERDERSGRRKMRNSAGVLGAGLGLAGAASRLGPGYPAALRQTKLIRNAAGAGMRLGGPQRAAQAAFRTAVRNPAGAALAGSALTVASAGSVYGTGAVQARNARRGVVNRRKENYRRQQERNQLLHVRKAETIVRYGAGSAKGRKIVDPYEPVGKAARQFDPDERRKHNQGRVAGAAGAAGVGALGYGAQQTARATQLLQRSKFDYASMTPQQKKLAQAAAKARKAGKRPIIATNARGLAGFATGAGLLGVSRQQTKRAKSDRNRTWG
jgi:hypothetical protein